MTSVSKAINAEIEKSCYICRGFDKRSEIETCRKKGGVSEHWAHKRCQRQWAQVQRDKGVVDDKITCAFLGCQRNLKDLLPQKSCFGKAIDCFKTHSAVQILSFGVPILAINAMLGHLTAGLCIGALLVSTIALDEEEAMAQIASGVAVEAAAGILVGLASELGVAAPVAKLAGALAAGVAPGNIVRGVADLQRDFIATGAAIAGVVGMSVWINGGGYFTACALSAISLGSTYWHIRRV